MKPKELVRKWITLFNQANPKGIADLYHPDAINYQVPNQPIVGKDKIRLMFEQEFASAEMKCIVENLFEDGEWAILEWKDPNGLRGCGFFHVLNDQIVYQRGYWDKLSFLKKHNLPIQS